jgi:hypothetical protein
MVTCIATQIPTRVVTVRNLQSVLMVFHRGRSVQPNRPAHRPPHRCSGDVVPSSGSSRTVYLKSEGLNRRDKEEGTRGMIFGRNTIVC